MAPYLPQFDAYQMRLSQLIDGFTHIYRFWMIPVNFEEAPGQDADQYEVVNADTTSRTFDTAVDSLCEAIKSRYTEDSSFTIAELWKVAEDSSDFTFLSAYTPTEQPDIVGTWTPAGQAVYTARTLSGSIWRLNILEGREHAPVVQPWVPDEMGVSDEVMAYFFTQWPTRFVVDRQGTYPFAALKAGYGTHERVWRARYR